MARKPDPQGPVFFRPCLRESLNGAQRVSEVIRGDFQGKIDFVAQNIHTAEFDEAVFQSFVRRGVKRGRGGDYRSGYPNTPIANPGYVTPGWEVVETWRKDKKPSHLSGSTSCG